MEKFGLFDLIEKLSPLKNTAQSLLPMIEKVSSAVGVKPPKDNQKPITPENKPKPSRPSTAPALAYIKRHEEMSKRIDLTTKKR